MDEASEGSAEARVRAGTSCRLAGADCSGSVSMVSVADPPWLCERRGLVWKVSQRACCGVTRPNAKRPRILALLACARRTAGLWGTLWIVSGGWCDEVRPLPQAFALVTWSEAALAATLGPLGSCSVCASGVRAHNLRKAAVCATWSRRRLLECVAG